MKVLDELVRQLGQARDVAKRAIQEAAKANDFQTVARLAAIADTVDQLMAEASTATAAPANKNQSAGSDDLQDTHDTAAIRAKNERFGEKKRPRDRRDYPVFFRQDNDLVKLGRSRSSPEEYEHRAPRSVVERVVKAVISAGGNKKRFGADVVFKQMGSESGDIDVPAYQVYVALAWLKWSGLIVQHGRQGYTVALPQKFTELAWSSWDQLGSR
jgi:hypothetical protein